MQSIKKGKRDFLLRCILPVNGLGILYYLIELEAFDPYKFRVTINNI